MVVVASSPAGALPGSKRPPHAPTGRSTPIKSGKAAPAPTKPGSASKTRSPSPASKTHTKQPSSTSKADRAFEASRKFAGHRPGFVFTTDKQGTGYYRDKHSPPAAPPSSNQYEDVLDPDEVFDSLPSAMQVAFDARDLPALEAVLAAMAPQEKAYHMTRCVRSGLWNPTAPCDEDKEEPGATDLQTGGATPKANGSSPKAGESSATCGAAAAGDPPTDEPSEDASPPAAATPAAVPSTPQLFERGSTLSKVASARGRAPTVGSASVAATSVAASSVAAASVAAASAAAATTTALKVGGVVPPTPPQRSKRPSDTAKRVSTKESAQGLEAMGEQLEAMGATLRAEQQARMAAEARAEALAAELEAMRKRLSEVESRGRLASEAVGSGMQQMATEPEGGSVVADSKTAVIDADEVLMSLPEDMRAAFAKLDEEALNAALARLPPAEAEQHMGRCIAAGLWQA